MRGLAQAATSEAAASNASASVLAAVVVTVVVTLVLAAAVLAVCAVCGGGRQDDSSSQGGPGGRGGYIPPTPDRTKQELDAPGPIEQIPKGGNVEVLEWGDGSGEELAEFLQRACAEARGHVPEKCRMAVESIQAGLSAASANMSNVYYVDTTALFFGLPERCKAHLKAHTKCGAFMPVLHPNESAVPPTSIMTETDGAGKPRSRYLFPDTHLRTANPQLVVHMPCHVRMDRVTPALVELEAACKRAVGRDGAEPLEKTSVPQLYNVILQLNKLLRSAHENGLVLRHLTLENIVFAQLEVQRGWTLLEFTSAVKVEKKSQSLVARRAPPELANNVVNGEPSEMHPSFDMWQLGLLLYQLASQPFPYTATYWDTEPGLSDAEILSRLIAYSKVDTPAEDPRRELLPHEAKPPTRGPMREVISHLLAPSAAARWPSEQLRVYLDINMAPVTQQGQTTTSET